MKDLDEVKGRMQVKHIGVGKSSEKFNRIPSALSAFTRVTLTLSKGWETSPILKERGWQEAIAMVEKFRNMKEFKKNGEEETHKTERNQQVQEGTGVQETQTSNTHRSEGSTENRQQKRQEY